METEKLLLVGVIGLIAGVLSGIGGGGAGLIMTPLYVFIGLTPQQAIGTSKMNGLGASLGGLSVFYKSGHIRMDIVKVMAPIAIVIGFTLPFLFQAIDSVLFQRVMGVMILGMTPLLFVKPRPRADGTQRKLAGYSTYTVVLWLQAMFSSGIGSLANYVLTLLLGTTKLEANATKRAVTATLVPITFVALLLGGFVVLSIGIVGMISMFIGTHVGSKIVVKKGEKFAAVGMAVVGAISGIALLVTA